MQDPKAIQLSPATVKKIREVLAEAIARNIVQDAISSLNSDETQNT